MTTTTGRTTDLGGALGAMTGQRYRASLRDGREVWLSGKRIEDIPTHPAFRGTVDEFARIYDLQHDPANRDVMTFRSPDTGNPLSRSYQVPRNKAELLAKGRNSAMWARECWGMLGRPPDFVSNVVVGLYDLRAELEANHSGFGRNATNYLRYAAEHDLALTHALGDPQIDRSASPVDDPDLALRIVARSDQGVVVRGAKQLATLAPLANEVLVYLSATFALREAADFVIWFAIPVNAPGLSMLCREPLGDNPHGHGHPMARRYDEQDAMLFFDDVLIPWERVFLLDDGALALRSLPRLNAWSDYGVLFRNLEKVRTFLALAGMMAESIGIANVPAVQEQIGELATYAELTRRFVVAAEAEAALTPGGLMAPGGSMAVGNFFAQTFPRFGEIIRAIGSSGIVMQPSEADLAEAELRPRLERYMRGSGIDVSHKSRLFRIAWDLSVDSWGSRQQLYERLHRGDPTRNRINFGRQYSAAEQRARIAALISRPLAT